MPRGSKDKYSDKQKRMAEHIEEGYEKHGVSSKEAKGRAWATVNKDTGGGEKSGSGRKTSAKKKTAARKSSARNAVAAKHGHSKYRKTKGSSKSTSSGGRKKSTARKSTSRSKSK